jgi:very-short-patch-repair endonuclease
MNTIKKCKWCLLDFETTNKPKGWMANHVRWCDKNPKKSEYRSNLEYARNCFLTNNTSIQKMKEGIRLAHKRGSYKHVDYKKLSTGYSHTDDAKRKISEFRKKYLSENPDSHVWKRNDKFKSTPCEILKNYLRSKNINFEEEYTNHGVKKRFFSIDIAFPDKKLAIEVNGNQHYESRGVLKPYYTIREKLLKEVGWSVIQIHYSLCFKEESLEKIYKMVAPAGL